MKRSGHATGESCEAPRREVGVVAFRFLVFHLLPNSRDFRGIELAIVDPLFAVAVWPLDGQAVFTVALVVTVPLLGSVGKLDDHRLA